VDEENGEDVGVGRRRMFVVALEELEWVVGCS